MQITESDFEEIKELSGAGYGPREIALYLGVPVKIFMEAWADEDHPIREHYDTGILETQATIGIQLAEQAKSGSLTAIQQYSKHMRGRHVADVRQRLLNGNL